jgi:hypothetical protein
MNRFRIVPGRCWATRRSWMEFLARYWVHPDAGWLSGKQFWNADQVIGDQIEQEVGGDASHATMFGLAHGAVLLARKCTQPSPGAIGICRIPDAAWFVRR